MTTLYDLAEGEAGIIVKVKGRGQFRQRLMEMGFIAGREITVVKKAPLRDPIEYRIIGYHVSLRSSESQLIEVTREAASTVSDYPAGMYSEEASTGAWVQNSRHIQVALLGNPNSGKTTLFNFASGSREKVANYAGVTVDSKEAKYEQSGYTFTIVDLPGTYSLKSYSPEEIYLRKYIFEKKPDIIINIVDSSNLERNLYLTTQLIDMGVQVVTALNMYDEMLKKGDRLDYKTLGNLFGIPIVPTVSSKGKGIKKLFDKVIEVYEQKEPTVRHIHINYGSEIEAALCSIQSKIKREENRRFTNLVAARYLALELLENDSENCASIEGCVNSNEILTTAKKESDRLSRLFTDPIDSVITDLRYGFIAGALKETLKSGSTERLKRSQNIDSYLTNRYLGIPIFMIFMWITFFTTFKLGGYPKAWLQTGISGLSELMNALIPAGIFRDFITDGLISGVGGVLVFLPNIIILFLFISFMEDSGYMARAVFIMDKVMHKLGLHGKSFIPLFMGFGCNVPAIMATRIIESRRDRLVTMLITPFMSCSARLPVYILFISAFFEKNQGLILMILYLFGAVLAIISALLLKKIYFKTQDIPFVMELPPYRMPTARSIVKHVWFRTGLYLRKIGGIILVASVIIWVLSNFPNKVNYSKNYEAEIASIRSNNAEVPNKLIKSDSAYYNSQKDIRKIEAAMKSEKQEKSIIGFIGHAMEPVMKPLGFDWKLSVSILTGVAAKEVVVSTLGVLYQAGDGDTASLAGKIKTSVTHNNKDSHAPLVAFSFMLFILTYFPCIGVVAAIKRESGGWKWAMFVVFYTTGVAWLLSFIVFQTGSIILG